MIDSQIISEVVRRTGIKLDASDPAFVLVELNKLMLENSASDASRRIEQAAKEFSEAAITQADDFVSVANEALGKFMTKTNEIKTLLSELEIHVPSPPPVQEKKYDKTLPIGALSFISGVVVGIALSFL